MLGEPRLRQFAQERQDLGSIPDVATRKFANDERMAQDLRFLEKRPQACTPLRQMCDPDRRINQDRHQVLESQQQEPTGSHLVSCVSMRFVNVFDDPAQKTIGALFLNLRGLSLGDDADRGEVKTQMIRDFLQSVMMNANSSVYAGITIGLAGCPLKDLVERGSRSVALPTKYILIEGRIEKSWPHPLDEIFAS